MGEKIVSVIGTEIGQQYVTASGKQFELSFFEMSKYHTALSQPAEENDLRISFCESGKSLLTIGKMSLLLPDYVLEEKHII